LDAEHRANNHHEAEDNRGIEQSICSSEVNSKQEILLYGGILPKGQFKGADSGSGAKFYHTGIYINKEILGRAQEEIAFGTMGLQFRCGKLNSA